ncbi:MAG: helix-turn-helix transcriptional regulator [Bacteroidales bacterium]|jgi:DNA-binding XRE family transcriptional regulator|nr:helix-turn-helix transcriptional regulator [Bacteroidales bacterium]
MEKTKVSFLNERNVLVCTPMGHNFVVGFTSNYHYQLEERGLKFTEFLASLFDKYYKGDSSVIMSNICRELMQNRCEMVYYVLDESYAERFRIGFRIKQLRKAQGLDIDELAFKAKIHPHNLYRIEEGKYSIKYDVLASIASALNMKIDFVEL